VSDHVVQFPHPGRIKGELYHVGSQINRSEKISKYLKERKIATLEDLKIVVESNGRMTVMRALSRLRYISSYSHRADIVNGSSKPTIFWTIYSGACPTSITICFPVGNLAARHVNLRHSCS